MTIVGQARLEPNEDTANHLDILTIQNDEISYVKHALNPFCVFFALFGCSGGSQGRRGTTC